MALCAVQGCPHPEQTRGFCRAHYARVLRHGAPDARQGAAGTGAVRLILSLPKDLSRDVKKAAAEEGLNVSEWLRRAARGRLLDGAALYERLARGEELTVEEQRAAVKRGFLPADSILRKGAR